MVDLRATWYQSGATSVYGKTFSVLLLKIRLSSLHRQAESKSYCFGEQTVSLSDVRKIITGCIVVDE